MTSADSSVAASLAQARRIVVKVGSSLMIDPESRTARTAWLATLAQDIAADLPAPLMVDGPRPVRQAADEAPFLEPGDQAVNAGFRFKPQGVLHFVEGGRDAGFAELLVDIHQKFVLFPGQHGLSPDLCGGRNQNPDKAGLVSRPAKNHIIWNKKLTFTLVLVWFTVCVKGKIAPKPKNPVKEGVPRT